LFNQQSPNKLSVNFAEKFTLSAVGVTQSPIGLAEIQKAFSGNMILHKII